MANKRIIKNVLSMDEELQKGSPNYHEILMMTKDALLAAQDENTKKLLLNIEYCAENILALTKSEDSKRRNFSENLRKTHNELKRIIREELLSEAEE